MQDYIARMIDNALPVAAVLSAAGAAAGYLGAVIPTTSLFMASGLLLMMRSGRTATGAAE
jgi:hypothetical protein